MVGGGLAGIILNQQLKLNKQKTIVITDPSTPSSSMVAAGTWNPITFKRFILSWRAKDFLKEMKLQYHELEQLLEISIYESLQVRKLVTPGDELNLWEKQAKEEMKEFMVENPKKTNFPKNLYLGEIKQNGRILVKKLLKSYHDHLQKSKEILYQKFDHTDLIKKNEGWEYQHIICKGVVFCEGSHHVKNPYFSWLPVKPVKGDLLVISAPMLEQNYMLKKNIFILPLGNHLYQVGATYNWQDLSWEPSQNGRSFLIEKLQSVINVPFQVVDQKAGLRPTSHDRRILMGGHPTKKNLFILNGLGSKGVLLAPLAAKELCNHMLNGLPITPEMDIKRCKKQYAHYLQNQINTEQ